MNILTFDIEEWSLEKDYFGNHKEKYAEFDRILDYILEALEQTDTTATFFCLGKIARDFPHVVRKIAAHGHEIGSHSHAHKWINKMTPEEFRKDTHEAISILEDVIGTKVESFRAPAFSIGESNKWAIEILAENGISNDASIFPGVRDFGGFPAFNSNVPCIIEYNGICLNEFPIPLYHVPLLGKSIAYSGGGYFRLLPISFVKQQIVNNDYTMCYFHIEDLINKYSPLMNRDLYEEYFKERGSLSSRLSRYFKSNIGRGRALQNLSTLIHSIKFNSIREYTPALNLTDRIVI